MKLVTEINYLIHYMKHLEDDKFSHFSDLHLFPEIVKCSFHP